MQETVLLFHTEEKTNAAIQKAFAPYHAVVKTIEKKDYNQTLGALSGIQNKNPLLIPYEGSDLDAPMVLFANIPDPKLDQMLNTLRRQNILLSYKAILTPTNQAWTPLQCFEEIKREHALLNSW